VSKKKLPKYVFERADGSYRYKRNVPKKLWPYLGKKTLYRSLGRTYEEMLAKRPIAHREIEEIFRVESMTHPSERARAIISSQLGSRVAEMVDEGGVLIPAEDGRGQYLVYPDDVQDDLEELADKIEHRVPQEVADQIRSGRLEEIPMTLERVFYLYLQGKRDRGKDTKSEEQRVERLARAISQALGAAVFAHKPLGDIRRKDAATLRDYLLRSMAPNSVLRNMNILKAAVNYVIVEEELGISNVFAKLPVHGAGAGKEDRLPFEPEELREARDAFTSSADALDLFVVLRDTGARLGEVVGLQVQDIKLETQSLLIRPNGLRGLKTKGSDREVPLSPEALNCLTKRIEGLSAADPVFAKYSAKRGNDRASAMLMKRLRTKIEDKKKTIHSLRHTMKDGLRNTDCPEHLSRAILGHSENSVAANYGKGYALSVMGQAMEKVWHTHQKNKA
jgi:integrase